MGEQDIFEFIFDFNHQHDDSLKRINEMLPIKDGVGVV